MPLVPPAAAEDNSTILLALSSLPNLQDELEFAEDPTNASRSLILQIMWQLEKFATEEEKMSYYQWLKTYIFNNNSDISNFIKRLNMKKESYRTTYQEIRTDIKKFLTGDNNAQNICRELSGNGSRDEESRWPKKNLVDGFMYESSQDFITKNGLESRHRCKACGSTNTKYLPLVSHSSSIESLIQLFTFALPDLKGKNLLDIGSGLGSILYGAFYLSKASSITGIELNSEFCDMVNKILSKYVMSSRVNVIQGNLKEHCELLRDQDVVIFNNSFEYFVPKSVQIELWKFIRGNMKSHSFLVTNPGLDSVLTPLELIDMKSEWVDETPLSTVDKEVISGLDQPDEAFHVYVVRPNPSP